MYYFPLYVFRVYIDPLAAASIAFVADGEGTLLKFVWLMVRWNCRNLPKSGALCFVTMLIEIMGAIMEEAQWRTRT